MGDTFTLKKFPEECGPSPAPAPQKPLLKAESQVLFEVEGVSGCLSVSVSGPGLHEAGEGVLKLLVLIHRVHPALNISLTQDYIRETQP